MSNNLKDILKAMDFPVKFFHKKMKSRLQNQNFSILCSSCIGGLIYHSLGEKFLSPTINTMILQPDFKKFIISPKKYLDEELVFIKEKSVECPVALLSDIKIYFTHYKTEEEASLSWNKRKKRINWNNVYIMMSDRDGLTENDIVEIEDKVDYANNIVIFTSRKGMNSKYAFYLQEFEGQPCVGNIMENYHGIGKRVYEKEFDYVDFLNGSI